MTTIALSTGIGSLPFTEIQPALDHVFANYAVPFYPQLPQAQDRAIPLMIAEVLTPVALELVRNRRGAELLALLEGDAGDVLAARGLLETLPGLPEFLKRARRLPLVKLQLVGPATLAAWISGQFPELPAGPLREATDAWISTLSLAVARLRTKSWLIWDDAQLALEDGVAFRALAADLAASDVRLGLHCCGPADATAILTAFRGGVLALDMSVVNFEGSEPALAAHHAAGGVVVFGAFDTRAAELDVHAGLERTKAARRLVVSEGGHAAGILGLSGGCGTGLHALPYEMALCAGLKMATSGATGTLL